MHTTITIASAPEDREAAICYVREQYRKRLGTAPGDAHTYLAAVRGPAIVGTIALEFAGTAGTLPIAELYRFDPADFVLSGDPSDGAQLCRWTAEDPDASIALVYAAAAHALALGKSVGWLDHTDAVHRVLTRAGIAFHPLPGARLCLERVPPGDRRFYETPPFARCYHMALAQARDALWERVGPSVREGRIVLPEPYA